LEAQACWAWRRELEGADLRDGARTIYHGLSDVRDQRSAGPGRVRGVRWAQEKAAQDPTLVPIWNASWNPPTRGDPMGPLLWTSRGLRNL